MIWQLPRTIRRVSGLPYVCCGIGRRTPLNHDDLNKITSEETHLYVTENRINLKQQPTTVIFVYILPAAHFHGWYLSVNPRAFD